jgi:hypothetical protein
VHQFGKYAPAPPQQTLAYLEAEMLRSLFLSYCLFFSILPFHTLTIKASPPDVAASAATSGEVIYGAPERIPYERAFPLLDGLFQDVSAIQLATLTVSPNNVNARNTKADIQQFQAALQYSQTLGLQNAAAAQQSAAYSAYGTLQTQLINQQAQLVTLQLNAQQQVTQAQTAVNTLPSDATADRKTEAQQGLDSAKANLDLITAQLANVKSAMATGFAAPSFTAPAPTPPAFPTPSNLTIQDSDTFSPTFSPSKQIENQVSLLWERLAQLVNTLAQSNNPEGISLIKFNTGIVADKETRARLLLTTRYSLTCGGDSRLTPKVMDLFPRIAAVNVADMKYKDNRLGLGAFLSFFGIGGGVSYTKEQLRISQALGQSSYITGFGIGTDSFGWIFSPSIGEEVISPGTRTTYALVEAPHGCEQLNLGQGTAIWDKSPVLGAAARNLSHATTPLRIWNLSPSTPINLPALESISYSTAELNGSPTITPVMMDIKLSRPMSREQTVAVNGLVLKRARNSFGRASSGGDGGLLQANALDANSWLPLSSTELILNLNPASFGRRFPAIVITSPDGRIDITGQISAPLEIAVDGRNYKCLRATTPCAEFLPPLGRPVAVTKRFSVARWLGPENQIIITVPDLVIPPGASNGNTSVLPPLQVASDSTNQPWSVNARVFAVQESENRLMDCQSKEERLICKAGALDFDEQSTFEISDPDFSGNAIRGSAKLERCIGDCREPLIWGKMDVPEWDKVNDNGWTFKLSMINVKSGEEAWLDDTFHGPIDCSNGPICTVNIPLPKSLFDSVKDSMQLQVKQKNGDHVGTVFQIRNLHIYIEPILSLVNEEQTRFVGQNLVFDRLKVGKRIIQLSCVERIDCSLLNAKYGPKDSGYLYFVDDKDKVRVPLTQVTAKGLALVAPHEPPKQEKKEPAKKGAAPSTPPASASGAATSASTTTTDSTAASPTQQLRKNPATRLFSVKE